ncbi:hypothetical protein DYB35_008252 [Aphanomyces astaci]|uniref:J domain-containing protein n=1 Tax=Aphanomyces astaci TaxID=112090 RepID=A0A418CZ50_APHAT|nr:hypothetical protein DYB35_008252 [Aphanomyces astaci]
MAARAGLILLEKNAALEVNVELLSTELRRYEVQHRELQMEVQSLRDQHKAAVLEVQAAHKEVKILQTSHRKERAAWHSSEEASQQQLRSLASELRAQQQLHQNSSSTTPLPHESQNNADFAKPSSSDDDPLSEDPRVTLLQTENDLLQTHLSQVLLELSQLQVTWSQSSYASNQRIQALEHDLHKLTRENKLLKDEQAEERELIDSLRTICHTYKVSHGLDPSTTSPYSKVNLWIIAQKIADARPFAASTCLDENNQECHDPDQGDAGRGSLGSSSSESSMHEDVMHMNTALERRVRELEAQVATSTPTVSEEHAVYIEEQLMGTREALKHTKQQWVAAVAAKKEALACTAAAHEELARMQEVFESMQQGATKPHDEDEHVDWMEDTVVHPAPPGWIAAVSLWMLMMFQMKVLLVIVLLAVVAWAEDLYEILGASSGATSQDLKRIYRKLSLKYHPDKVASEERDSAQAKFLKIANAYRVLSDPARREKYDLYGIADDEGFKNFDEAFKHARDSVEDTPLNWIILIIIVSASVGPILYFKFKAKPKAVNNARREV